MAGDWLKMTHALPEKPEVLEIAGKTSLSRFEVVGRLFTLWRWFDTNTVDGNAVGVTKVTLNECLFGYGDVTNFVSAVISAHWLRESDDGISVINFDEHISESAKTRAQTAKRVAKSKANASNAKGNGESVTKTVPREEKRREEKSNRNTATAVATPDGVSDELWSDFKKLRATKKAAVTQTAIDGISREAALSGLTLSDALAMCCERGWSGFKAEWAHKNAMGQPINKQTALESRNRAVADQWLRDQEQQNAPH